MVGSPYAPLLAARPDDAYLRWEVRPDQIRYSAGRADGVVLVAPSAYHGKLWLTGLGDPATVAALASSALGAEVGQGIAGISLPDASVGLLPDDQRPDRLERWMWWSVERAPDVADQRVQALRPDDQRVPGLLDQSGSVYLRPGDPRAIEWHGLAEGGELLACLAVERHHPQVPHLASVVVDGAARGRGLGRALCGTVTGQLLAAGAPAVSLAMMSDNVPATGLYEGLGFRPGAGFSSGTLPGRRDLPPVPGWAP